MTFLLRVVFPDSCLDKLFGVCGLEPAVGNAMGWCPTRENIIEKFLFGTDAEMIEAAKRYIAVLRPLLNQEIAIMDKNDVNFPDKV